MKVRVRFAPSPTGFLHIGGARTALFNWLYARHTGGTFILRIEDTDAARNTQPAVDVILDGLRWLGLDWDEGPVSSLDADLAKTFDKLGITSEERAKLTQRAANASEAPALSKGNHGPYFQSQRGDNYKKRVAELLSKGLAYEHEGAIKFKMQREPVIIPDLVVGNVTRDLTDREKLDPDFVIVRSDGQPVFHLVNVIDDLEMEITHVIRGEDHLSNTAKHIALFKAFGVAPPQYAHIPLILNIDGTKMSKRDKGASLMTYLEEGYAPEAVINYLCLLGWSPKENREKVPIKEVVELFDLPQILRHNARFDLNKLHWLNGEYIREMSDERFAELAVPALTRAGIATSQFSAAYVQAALATCKQKVKLFSEVTLFGGFYFKDEVTLDAQVLAQDFSPDKLPNLKKLRDAFAASAWSVAEIERTLKATAAELGVKAGVLIHPLRLICTGSTIGPSLYHLLEVLGKERVLARFERVLN